jgi:hypothetical protein
VIATFITLAALISFSLFGMATLSLVKSNVTRNDLFTAPALGTAILLLPAISLVRGGLAGHTFALLLVALLMVASVVAIARRPPPASALRGAALPAGIITALTVIVVGLPQLHYGLNWLAFSNDDMANYALDATRLVRLDEFAEPKLANLITSARPDEWTWFIFAKNGDRYGFDLLLALVASVTRISTIELFMPVMLALYGTLCLAALAVFAKDRSSVALAWIGAAMVLAPANVVSVYYQVGPQIAGLAVLATAYYFLTSTGFATTMRGRAEPIALAALAFACLIQTYPEVMPILIVALGLCAARRAWPLEPANLRSLGWFVVSCASAACIGIAVLGYAGIDAIILTVAKIHQGARLHSSGFISFAPAVTTSGIAATFGLAPIAVFFGGNAVLALSLCFAALAAFWVVRSFFLRDEKNILTLAFGILLTLVIESRNGYGAFKTALYMQPFLFGTLADIVLAVRLSGRWRLVAAGATAALSVPMFVTLAYYIERGDDPLPSHGANYTQIASASASGLTSDLRAIAANVAGHTVVSDSYSESLSKFESSFLAPDSMRFQSHNPFFTLANEPFHISLYPRQISEQLELDSVSLISRYAQASRRQQSLPMRWPGRVVTFSFAQQPAIDAKSIYIYQGRTFTVLNRSGTLPSVRSVGTLPYAKTCNALVFIDSTLGVSPNYGLKASLFKPEPDYFYPGDSMSAVGRTFLFEIVNPTPHPRLTVWFTRTVLGAGKTALPADITIYGASSQNVRLGGNGSARFLSEPIEPAVVDGHSYIALDLHLPAKGSTPPKAGLASLFNGDLISDNRPIDGYARDISVVSNDREGASPSVLANFPADLRCCVEYSGLYEDGWTSRDSWYGLRSNADSGELAVSGSIPAGIATNLARVDLDGRTVWTQKLYPGEFEFTIPLPPHFKIGKHRVALHFGGTMKLGGGDGRPASALLARIGFQPA